MKKLKRKQLIRRGWTQDLIDTLLPSSQVEFDKDAINEIECSEFFLNHVSRIYEEKKKKKKKVISIHTPQIGFDTVEKIEIVKKKKKERAAMYRRMCISMARRYIIYAETKCIEQDLSMSALMRRALDTYAEANGEVIDDVD